MNFQGKTEDAFNLYKSALLIMFINTPLWRAIGISTVALMTILMFIDSNTSTRNTAYHQRLLTEKQQAKR